ncbi:MAG: hypothetical protein NWE99_09410 [Candidatus Bathyarchaeota archaeon]|nr:hypothetical protein [Candidatus Bathyarchaeota archaeon]
MHKPAGWWWSTPDEVFEDGVCWTVTRFEGKLLGLKIWSTGTLQKPRIRCTVYFKTKLDAVETQGVTRMLKRALKNRGRPHRLLQAQPGRRHPARRG